MRAVRFVEGKLGIFTDTPVPTARQGQALVRVGLAGICSTDLELVKGYFGFEGTLGHEFVGTVEQCAQAEWVGRRVVSSINFVDPASESSAFPIEHHPDRKVLGILGWDGCMADYVVVPVSNLLAVPSMVSDRQAVFSEPLAAALRIASQIRVDPAYSVCVLGPGRLGMLVARVLSLGGAKVCVAGRNPESLRIAENWSLPASLSTELPVSSFDIVVDTTGNPAGLQRAIELCRPLGTVVLKSTFEAQDVLNLTKVVVDEIRIVGSRCGPFEPALRLLERNEVPTEALIDGVLSPEDFQAAFELAAKSGVRKVLLDFAN